MRDVLSRLLDDKVQKSGHIFTLTSRMGRIRSYLASMNLSWVAENVCFPDDFPLFEKHSETKKISINETNADMFEQHKLDWRRQLPMTSYLAKTINRKFPPLLVVAYQSWTYQDRHQNDIWDVEGRATQDSIYEKPLDSNGYFIEIMDENTIYYALDGKHRLMAIKGLKELLLNNRLPARDKNGKNKTKGGLCLDKITDSVVESYKNLEYGPKNKAEAYKWLQELLSETMGVEIIPAVNSGETKEEAATRLWQIFSNVD